MDEAGAKRRLVDDKVDRISNLPESLLCKILLNLPTKVVVKTSLLSSSWRNLWKCVPRLDLASSHHFKENYSIFVTFVDRFLGFNSDFCFESFKLRYGDEKRERDFHLLIRWFNTVFNLNVKHVDFTDCSSRRGAFLIPQTIYTCEKLETRDHLFFSCHYGSKIWAALAKGLLKTRYTTDWSLILEYISSQQLNRVEGFLIRYVFQVVVYSIWRERNGRRHGEDPQPADSIIRWIDKQIRNQISAIRQQGDRRYETAYQLWLQARD